MNYRQTIVLRNSQQLCRLASCQDTDTVRRFLKVRMRGKMSEHVKRERKGMLNTDSHLSHYRANKQPPHGTTHRQVNTLS